MTNRVWELDEDKCTISITVDYANLPGLCKELITKVVLLNIQTQETVPGYNILANGQELELT